MVSAEDFVKKKRDSETEKKLSGGLTGSATDLDFRVCLQSFLKTTPTFFSFRRNGGFISKSTSLAVEKKINGGAGGVKKELEFWMIGENWMVASG